MHQLPEIPVFDVGPDFPIETVRLAGQGRAYAMLDAATAGVPMFALKAADAISRRWLSARPSRYLRELSLVSARDLARTLACAGNEWQTPEWHPRHHSAFEHAKRLAAIQTAPSLLDLR
jgi:hypothetical protein